MAHELEKHLRNQNYLFVEKNFDLNLMKKKYCIQNTIR